MNLNRDQRNPMRLTAFIVVVAALLLAACAPAAAVAPTNSPVPVPTNTTAPAAAPTAPVAMVNLANNSALGSFLVDGKGMTLYVYTKDTADTDTCTGGCAKAWPPLLTSGTPTAGTGVDNSKLATITLSDGTTQVTYNHMPLYYFAKDKAAGDTLGQNVGTVWFVVAADGTMITMIPGAATATPSASAAGMATVNLGNSAALGSFLVDGKGMTLYVYTKDTADTNTCSGGCAKAWPPLLTTGAPAAGTGVDSSKLGIITLTDGTTQVTYNHMPLYYFVKDKTAGDTLGQNVGTVWFVVAADGTMITTAPAASTATPSASMGTVNLGTSTALGSFLVDNKGMTLYIYTKDTPDTDTCSGGCAKAWPPLLTTDTPTAGTGVDSSKLATITLTDGTKQVTYNHMPLYYFAKDKAAGDTLGQNVGKVWFVVAADGTMITTVPPTPAPTTAAASGSGVTLMTSNTAALGTFLVDDKGMTLYIFTKDTAGVSNCSGDCLASWPALLTTGAPAAGMGVDASKLGTITRSDGSKQVTYNGKPLYYWVGDKKAGDTTGQGVGSVWYVLAP